ncbi:MAG TPA: methyltransferase domain-containing protein [Elusimicrobiota bacterium]|nr:methyltransferase domain-containing protein [Elusimicrobiota bacterium]
MSAIGSPDFSARSAELELMDSPNVEPKELRRTLEELSSINRWLGGYGPSLDALVALLPEDSRKFSLLDVGCGGGDTVRRIADWAKARGKDAEIEGIDLSETSVLYAQEKSRAHPRLRFLVKNLDDVRGDGRYDIVHAALLLHHFPGQTAVEALGRMHALCRYGVIINDLDRHPAAYWSIRLITRALSRNRLIRNDAPLSVLRAFKRSCLKDMARQAGLPAPDIRWRWPFRWQMIIRK